MSNFFYRQDWPAYRGDTLASETSEQDSSKDRNSGTTYIEQERFLSDEELSKILRVSRRTLQEYCSAGAIPYYLIQGKALYKESEIEKILNDSHKRP